jgi:hypothetical protein
VLRGCCAFQTMQGWLHCLHLGPGCCSVPVHVTDTPCTLLYMRSRQRSPRVAARTHAHTHAPAPRRPHADTLRGQAQARAAAGMLSCRTAAHQSGSAHRRRCAPPPSTHAPAACNSDPAAAPAERDMHWPPQQPRNTHAAASCDSCIKKTPPWQAARRLRASSGAAAATQACVCGWDTPAHQGRSNTKLGLAVRREASALGRTRCSGRSRNPKNLKRSPAGVWSCATHSPARRPATRAAAGTKTPPPTPRGCAHGQPRATQAERRWLPLSRRCTRGPSPAAWPPRSGCRGCLLQTRRPSQRWRQPWPARSRCWCCPAPAAAR